MKLIKNKVFGVLVAVVALIAILFGAANAGVDQPQPEPEQPVNNDLISEPGPNSSFEIHFIDVGEGDATLIVCDGEAMLIDGGEANQSSKIYSYLKTHKIDKIKYLVATHGHSDHVGGLSAALNYAEVETVLSSTTSYPTDVFEGFLRQLDKNDLSINVAVKGDIYELGAAKVLVVGPSKNFDNENDNSLVIKVNYGSTSFLIAGDAERAAESDMIADSALYLSSTVLRVGHHGSDTSTSYPFLREIMPSYAVISVGDENTYGHPHETVLRRLEDAESEILRTDVHGTIIMHSDGANITYVVERNGEPVEDEQITGYIGNINSKKFHRADCSNLPAEKNRIMFDARQDAIDQGFAPCGNCKP